MWLYEHTFRQAWSRVASAAKSPTTKAYNNVSSSFKEVERLTSQVILNEAILKKMQRRIIASAERSSSPVTLKTTPSSSTITKGAETGYHTPNVHNTEITKVSCKKLSPITGTLKIKALGSCKEKSGYQIKLSFLSYDSCNTNSYTPGKSLPFDTQIKEKCSGTLAPGQFWGVHAPKESTDRQRYTLGYERLYNCECRNAPSSSVTR